MEPNQIGSDPVEIPEGIPGGTPGGSPASSPQPGEAEALGIIKTITGRDFSSVTDVSNYFKGLARIASDQSVAEARKKAGEYDSLRSNYERIIPVVDTYAKEKGMTREQVLQSVQAPSSPSSTGASALPPELQEVLGKVQSVLDRDTDRTFLEKYPHAAGVLKEVRAIAKMDNIPLEDAFNNSQLAKFVKPANPGEAVIEPSRRLGNQRQYEDAFAAAKRTGNWGEVLKLKGYIPGI